MNTTAQDSKANDSVPVDEAEEKATYKRYRINSSKLMRAAVEGEEKTNHGGLDDDEKETNFTPFNLTDERADGFFDEHGNYFEHKKKRLLGDAWLEEFEDDSSVQKMERAKLNPFQPKKTSGKDSAFMKFHTGQLQLLLVRLLHPHEDAMDAMRRLSGGSGPSDKPTSGKPKLLSTKERQALRKEKRRKVEDEKESKVAAAETGTEKTSSGDKDPDTPAMPPPPPPSLPTTDFERVTEICDVMLNRGITTVYTMKREQHLTMLARHKVDIPLDLKPAQFEYRFTADGEEGEVFGPFPIAQMRAWTAEGYFHGEKVTYIRQVSGVKKATPFQVFEKEKLLALLDK